MTELKRRSEKMAISNPEGSNKIFSDHEVFEPSPLMTREEFFPRTWAESFSLPTYVWS
jgi:hypothetical protein